MLIKQCQRTGCRASTISGPYVGPGTHLRHYSPFRCTAAWTVTSPEITVGAERSASPGSHAGQTRSFLSHKTRIPQGTHCDHIDEGGLSRILQTHQSELHFLLPEEGPEPVQEPVYQSQHLRIRGESRPRKEGKKGQTGVSASDLPAVCRKCAVI